MHRIMNGLGSNGIEKVENLVFIHHGNVCLAGFTCHNIVGLLIVLCVAISFRLFDLAIGDKHGSVLVLVFLMSSLVSGGFPLAFYIIYLWQL